MQRYFIEANQIDVATQSLTLTGDDVHHIKNVMRLEVEGIILCCDGVGTDYRVMIEQISGKEIRCRILESFSSTGEPERVEVTIAFSLPKGDKVDWVLQKGTELGASAFLPFTSARTVVKLDEKKAGKRRDRWQRIVKEAAEQSRRGRIPTVHSLMNWRQCLAQFSSYDQILFAYERGGKALYQLLTGRKARSILVIVGPEGGFTEDEATEVVSEGAELLHLGPRILRAETAPLAAIACIHYTYGELGGEPL
ncbi:16S rRNA (uracil1498-N3)-methyltransferase [Marininema mesophilum]|uniref:Ribosomal RNA small subunit methyltransferase E n=1 Tax=Marininema mesophilum TaxID=1048340 RepID=A0A1H2R780_9BACL|nr:16S rRNA (uracil(1498)-N(3))-methyltransferase [Marininema mesophilum]SDW15312.1 16S rRNA (uracil1498-N3)-methyltransferase [Marininema mesophilum]